MPEVVDISAKVRAIKRPAAALKAAWANLAANERVRFLLAGKKRPTPGDRARGQGARR